MAKRQRVQQRDGLTVLPIVGHAVAEVRLRASQSPIIVFVDEHSNESRLRLEEAVVTLSHGNQSLVMEGSRSGAAFQPKSLAPLVELLGCSVVDATAQPKGRLLIEFSGSYTLSVVPRDFEGWLFSSERLSLAGIDGGLV